jgi:hypothetical protein
MKTAEVVSVGVKWVIGVEAVTSGTGIGFRD